MFLCSLYLQPKTIWHNPHVDDQSKDGHTEYRDLRSVLQACSWIGVHLNSVSHTPACWSWPPAAAPADGRSSAPPNGCLSACALSPTAPSVTLTPLSHPAQCPRGPRTICHEYQHQAVKGTFKPSSEENQQLHFLPRCWNRGLFRGAIHIMLYFGWRWGGCDRCCNLLYICVWPFGSLFTEGLVEGAPQLDVEQKWGKTLN